MLLSRSPLSNILKSNSLCSIGRSTTLLNSSFTPAASASIFSGSWIFLPAKAASRSPFISVLTGSSLIRPSMDHITGCPAEAFTTHSRIRISKPVPVLGFFRVHLPFFILTANSDRSRIVPRLRPLILRSSPKLPTLASIPSAMFSPASINPILTLVESTLNLNSGSLLLRSRDKRPLNRTLSTVA